MNSFITFNIKHNQDVNLIPSNIDSTKKKDYCNGDSNSTN